MQVSSISCWIPKCPADFSSPRGRDVDVAQRWARYCSFELILYLLNPGDVKMYTGKNSVEIKTFGEQVTSVAYTNDRSHLVLDNWQSSMTVSHAFMKVGL